MAAGLFSPLAVPAPDLLVSSDARLIAWRGDAGYALLAAPGASWFVRDAWRAHLGVDVWRPLGPGCDDDTCRMGGALLLRNRDARPDCTGVQLVISPEPARGVCPQAILLDRFTVWRDGSHAVWLNDFAHAVWLNNGAHAAWPNDGVATVLSDRADRGTRPWVPPPPSPRRRPSTLPMAPAEALPAATED
jgi:competence protein ComEC